MKKSYKNVKDEGNGLFEKNDTGMGDSTLGVDLPQGHDSEEDMKLKRHIFLEDLRFVNKHNKEYLEQGTQILNDILQLTTQLQKKMGDLGEIFQELSTSVLELEESRMEDIVEIKPSISKICKDLKLSFYSWSNIYSHQFKHMKKLFEPCLEKMNKENKSISEVSSKNQG